MTIYEDRARRRRNIAILVAAGVLFVLLWRGCASFTGGPVWGRVIDIDTGRPITGAIVVAQWRGSLPFAAGGVCFHVETAVSDPDGRYQIPPWWQTPRPVLIFGSTVITAAYRRGYEDVHSHTKEAESHPEDVYLKKYVGNDSERFEYISKRIFGGMGCGGGESSERNLYPLLKAAYQEAKGLANSVKQETYLDGMRDIAASAWLAAPSDSPGEVQPLTKLPAEIKKDLE